MNTNQENFKSLFDTISDFIFILDLKGRIIEINKTVEIQLGYKQEELFRQDVLLVHPPELRNKAKEIIELMIADKKVTCNIPLMSKEGINVPVETKVTKGKWNNEDALIGISRNMSDIFFSEEKFYKVFENSKTLMSISEIETGNFINVNKSFLNTLGYDESEIIGNNSKELNIYNDYKQREKLIEKTKSGTHIFEDNIKFRTKDGQLIECLVSMYLFKIQAYTYLLTSATNINPLKQAEKKLQKSHDQQKLLANISQELLSLENFDEKINKTLELIGKHTNVSRVYIFEDITEGYETKNTYEWCNTGIIPQINDLQSTFYDIIPSWKEILKKEGKIFSENIKDLPDDIIKVLEPQEIKSILAFPLIVQNKFFGFIGFDECIIYKTWDKEEVELLRTISGIISNFFERHICQKQLTESEIQLKLAIENTHAGLWDWNIITGELFFNEAWCDMLGYKKEELEPKITTWENLIHPDDKPKVINELHNHLEGKVDNYEPIHRLLMKNGEWKWIYDKGKVIEYDINNKPSRAIGINIDIDNQKKAEEELRNINLTKDKLFSIIAHDLRGPISSMMQISEMITDNNILDKETFNDFLHSQKELSFNTFQLLDNLLNWAKYNSQHIKCTPTEINLNSIIDECIAHTQYSTKRKSLSILTDNSEIYTAFADKDMIKIIIRNLLSNAIKFTSKGGYIKIDFEKNKDFIEIKITDTGIGISPEIIEKIMSDNNYYSTFGTDNEKGTGLGLVLCKNFILQNNGKLKIESKINKGTTFSFTLPKAINNFT